MDTVALEQLPADQRYVSLHARQAERVMLDLAAQGQQTKVVDISKWHRWVGPHSPTPHPPVQRPVGHIDELGTSLIAFEHGMGQAPMCLPEVRV